MTRPLCIYHANCLDGFAAAWVVWKYYRGEVDLHPGVYSEAPPDVKGRDVILVDFSYKRGVMLQLGEKAKKLNIIDHHKSALEELADLDLDISHLCDYTATFDLEHSGAFLTWHYFFGDREVPLLIQHVEDRDLWRFKLSHTREVTAALMSYPYDTPLWDDLMGGNCQTLTQEGVALLRAREKEVAEVISTCKRYLRILGHTVPALSAPYTFSSDAGHLMCQGEPFAAVYYDVGDKRCFSLRSHDGGQDVSLIAKQFGGGGHRNAAGFSVSIQQAQEFEV